MGRRITKVAWLALCLVPVAIGVSALLRPISGFPALPAATANCTVRDEGTLADIAGLHFQLTRKSCDTLAKDVSVSRRFKKSNGHR
jgi:hypothetical protein